MLRRIMRVLIDGAANLPIMRAKRAGAAAKRRLPENLPG